MDYRKCRDRNPESDADSDIVDRDWYVDIVLDAHESGHCNKDSVSKLLSSYFQNRLEVAYVKGIIFGVILSSIVVMTWETLKNNL